jgi:hypothetical protein
MRNAANALAAVCALLLSLSSNASVYKCVGPDGRTEYQDVSCEGRPGGEVTINPNVVTPIDQTANLLVNREISARLAARARADADAQRGPAFEPPPVPAYSPDDSPLLDYYYPSYLQRRRPILRHLADKRPMHRTVPAPTPHRPIER